MRKRVLVCGAGGFIGGHLVRRLCDEGCWVRAVDLKRHEFSPSPADEFIVGDLRDPDVVRPVLEGIDKVYQLAADMGGAGYLFTGEHDACVMHNSATINLNVREFGRAAGVNKYFYSSSACIYPAYNQTDPNNPKCSEDSAYPAAICRRVAEAPDGSEIEIWGDGKQTRSFPYVDECIEGMRRLMDSDFAGPVNIGSDEMVTINQLAEMACDIARKRLRIKHIDGPLGVRGRNSDNRLIRQRLGWTPSASLRAGLEVTYAWIAEQVREQGLGARGQGLGIRFW